MTIAYDFSRPLRIGTRGSPLALWQANRVSDVLMAAGLVPGTEIVEIRTTGDKVQNRLLAEIGGKGLFSKEIEEELAAGRIDIAVHSMKDVETELAPGFAIAALLERADPRDAWISASGEGLDYLPAGARVGTASLRRKAQVLARRPDLTVLPFRGNVGTRLGKLAGGEADATLLAKAGLDRLEMTDCITEALAPEIMLPAAAQGAVGIEARLDDTALLDALRQINHGDTSITVKAERALLAALDGSCRTPIGAYAVLGDAGDITLQALLASEDGTKTWRTERRGAAADADRLGADAGAELRAAGDAHLFED
jgi:hydroxymethylbilane synthase